MIEQAILGGGGGRLKTFQSRESLGLSEEGNSNLPSLCLRTQDISYLNPSGAYLWAF